MQELTLQEIEQVSGAGVTIPTFPAGGGLAGGLATILAAGGYAVSTLVINTGLGLGAILGVQLPEPSF